MVRIKSLKQVEGLSTANFADDDAIWTVSQRGLQQIPYRYRRETALLMSSLEADQVALADIQLGGVLNEQNSFVIRNEISQDIQQSGLSRSSSSADQDILPIGDSFTETIGNGSVQGAVADQVVHREMSCIEFANCERDAINAARRKDRGDAASVWKSRIQDWLGFGNVISQAAGDVLDCRIEGLLGDRDAGNRHKLTVFLNEYPGTGIDHDFRNIRVQDQMFDGSQERKYRFKLHKTSSQ
jgi:hypothetical protein